MRRADDLSTFITPDGQTVMVSRAELSRRLMSVRNIAKANGDRSTRSVTIDSNTGETMSLEGIITGFVVLDSLKKNSL